MMARVTCGFLAILLGANVIAAQNWWPFASDIYPDVYPEDLNVWMNRNSWIDDNYAPCVVRLSTGDLEGTCTHGVDCKLSEGRSFSRGNCSILQSCCTYEKTCGQTVKSRVAYFKQPRNPRINVAHLCSLKVDVVNDNVCQMRVDIEAMTLSVPTASTPVRFIHTVNCDDDKFTVSSFSSASKVRLPTLCGSNANTHFYIHLAEGQKQVSLDYFLSAKSTLINPTWEMKITQLECPSLETKFDFSKKKENRNQAYWDYKRLAPEGCLQYYTEPTGTVKSFGFLGLNHPRSTLTTSQNYAICFKNFANCGVSFTPTQPVLRNQQTTNTCPNAHIYVPSLETPRICENNYLNLNMNHGYPGPSFIQVFINNAYGAATTIAGGFSWKYTINTDCNI